MTRVKWVWNGVGTGRVSNVYYMVRETELLTMLQVGGSECAIRHGDVSPSFLTACGLYHSGQLILFHVEIECRILSDTFHSF